MLEAVVSVARRSDYTAKSTSPSLDSARRKRQKSQFSVSSVYFDFLFLLSFLDVKEKREGKIRRACFFLFFLNLPLFSSLMQEGSQQS